MSAAIQELLRDLRVAFRGLRRSPGWTIVAVGTLGLAIGATAGMADVVATVLWRPLPFAAVDRLVYIAGTAPGSQMPPEFGVANELITPYRESPFLEEIASINAFTATLRTPERVERVLMSYPSRTMFETLGVRPILGRLPGGEDEDRTALISYTLWTTWFGSDPNVVGRSYEMAGAPREIIGVMGPGFRFPFEGMLLWITGSREPQVNEPGQFNLPLVGRMAPGMTTDRLADELTAISKRMPDQYPGSQRYRTLIARHRAVVRPLREQLLGPVERPLYVLLGGVGIVLLIASANVANLFMVRASARRRELAVRRAVGAGRIRIIRLQMAEALVVAALGGIVAMGFAAVLLPLFVRAAPADIPRLGDVTVDLTTLGLTLAVAFAAAMACGLVPALWTASPRLSGLRDAERGSTRGRQWGRDGLVAAQTAMALVLLIGSGLLVRSFIELRRVDPGYDTEDIFTFQIAPEEDDLTDGPSFARFSMDFMERLRGLPGVQMVGLVENVPLNESTAAGTFRTEEMAGDSEAGVRLQFTFAAGDYFEVMGISLLAGETFDTRNLDRTLGNVVVSRSAADLLWPNQNAVGHRVEIPIGGDDAWMTVIGVAEDVMQSNFREMPQPLVYFPLLGPAPNSWVLSSPAYVVRTPRAETIAPEVRTLAQEVAPSAPMYRVFTMDGLARDSMRALSFTMLTLGILSGLALILGVVGLYGVLSYAVAARTREIGVRMALGAQPGRVRRMIVAQGAWIVASGMLVGIGVAIASARMLDSLLFGVAPLDVPTFVGVSAAMLAIGLAASYIPARNASSVNPTESLRAD